MVRNEVNYPLVCMASFQSTAYSALPPSTVQRLKATFQAQHVTNECEYIFSRVFKARENRIYKSHVEISFALWSHSRPDSQISECSIA
ncbi:hypothetical protein LAUMK142_03213 [Mycobacterium pseudokansasii]|uniref:Uncharacterized protein n=1 Tax=Mycobacterium pseudokansasii TaxID=2341080 RepID=A0A498QTN0_9MYCO|nr:hypothetical protein LAUMK142_03213 [Mycobacterium pseudokansasii]